MISHANMVDIDTMNSLLRGEISAVESYTKALDFFQDNADFAILQGIRREHSRAVRALRDHIMRFGGMPSSGSGAWGTFVAAVGGAARVMGQASVLATLREGEEHGISEYERAIESGSLHVECERLIRTELLPSCRAHLEHLQEFAGRSSRS